MRVIVTGSRNLVDPLPVWRWLDAFLISQGTKGITVVHGGARAADSAAQDWADANGMPVDVFPAYWKTHGKAAGPIRNQAMVDAGADIVLAFPKGASPGTRDCIRRAQAAGIPVRVEEIP